MSRPFDLASLPVRGLYLALLALGLGGFDPAHASTGSREPLLHKEPVPPHPLFWRPAWSCVPYKGLVYPYTTNTSITIGVGDCLDFSELGHPLDLTSWSFGSGTPPTATGNADAVHHVQFNTAGTTTVHDFHPAFAWGGPYLTVNVVNKPNVTVAASITADNGYRFGYGTQVETTFMNPAVNNFLAAQIYDCTSGPEAYTVTLPVNKYLYLAAWSDDDDAQSIMGQFRVVAPLTGPYRYTGNANWQVFATGIDEDGLPGPSDAEINAQIAIANAGTGGPGTSITWVNYSGGCAGGDGYIVASEQNDPAVGTGTCPNVYSQVCPTKMKLGAKWMWYDSTGSGCPSAPGANHREFLIFRMPVSVLTKGTYLSNP